MELVHFIPPSERRTAVLAAQADSAPVLICGGAGTGKSAIARWIHLNGPRSTRPILTAIHNVPLSEQIPTAQGGTLLIPEIGEWGLAEQKNLLDFLNTKSISVPHNGGLRMLVNTRIMVTTSQALEGRAQSGMFNAELLAKLREFRIEMPHLNRRLDEFEDIVLGITGEIAKELHKEHLRTFSDQAWERIRSYEWPGNVREVRNVLRLAVLKAEGSQIESSDLPDFGHDRMDFRTTRAQFEKIYIQELLKTHNWEIDRACQITRMNKEILLQKIKQYGLKKTSASSSEA